ncbi:MAG TPA: DNA-formamidopyrimidine glycosylase family protein [Solirubrobacteraceae bacterium]
MPELPDVEGFRRYLADHAQGKRVKGVAVLDRAIVRNRSPQTLGRALRGHRFATPQRHGKWLIAPVGEVELLLHFGMTGGLHWATAREPRDRHDRVVFQCAGGELRYNNMRRFGGVWLARDASERTGVTGPLGPDAAALDRQGLEELLQKRRGGIKAALMDQRLLAGVGNLLSDEILWRAKINPRAPVAKLSQRRRDRLYEALHDTIVESSRYGQVPRGRGWLTGVRDDPAGRCPRCATRLRHGTVAGRTACWCPTDQRR